jgi:5-methyltetrahydropteroyltriglutamate--homocysteine methyltransferase
VKDRLTGFGGVSRNTNINAEGRDFPEWLAKRNTSSNVIARPACDGPVAWRDFAAVEREIANLQAAVAGQAHEDVFMSAASPGVIATFLPNEYYPSHEKYIEALADVMRDEYNAIVNAGFVLQLDCPDLAMTRHNRHIDKTLAEFRDICELHIQAINEATKDIPAESMRLHLCWGNYEGPHHMDVAMTDIVDIVLKGRPAGISFEGANPRHEHEWKVWRDVDASGRVVIPGVIDSTSNFIEHPELVARVGALEADAGGATLEHDVDDVGHRHVHVVRALVIAPAQVQAHRLGWDVLRRLVLPRCAARRCRETRPAFCRCGGCDASSPGRGSRAAGRSRHRRWPCTHRA